MLDKPQRVTSEAPHRAAPASALEIFRERCEARVLLCANGYLDLQTAVDQLQESAAAQGLLKQYGQDEIQQILSEAFARWRYDG
jgi:hypothetical protein